MIKILFICHGNICRSPMAEYIFKDLVKKEGLSKYFFIASAATSSEELGNPIYYSAQQKLKEHGVPYDNRQAVRLQQADYHFYDYLLAMDKYNLSNMRRILGNDLNHKLFLLLDFTSHPRNIADPWYSGDFEQAYCDILEGCHSLLAFLKQRKLLD